MTTYICVVLLLTFFTQLQFCGAHPPCSIVEKVNKHIAALNTYNADTTNTRALAEAAEFFKRIEFHGKRLTVETLAFMFEHLDSSVTLEHVAMTTDTAIIVWREHFLMGDGTTFDTRETTIARFDLKTCEPVTLDQIMDPQVEKALWAHFDKMVAGGIKVSRPAKMAEL